jgi:hypothetical protein
MPKKHQGDTADARIREKIEAVFSKKTVCGTDNPLFELAKCTSANVALQNHDNEGRVKNEEEEVRPDALDLDDLYDASPHPPQQRSATQGHPWKRAK